jgi:threonyl-tRNA synthetase
MVIPITDDHLAYAQQVQAELSETGLRVEVDDSSRRMNAKIRDAQLQKIPYMLIVGDREREADAVAVRTRGNEDRGAVSLAEFAQKATTMVKTKSKEL